MRAAFAVLDALNVPVVVTDLPAQVTVGEDKVPVMLPLATVPFKSSVPVHPSTPTGILIANWFPSSVVVASVTPPS